jgi:hypothetical protein
MSRKINKNVRTQRRLLSGKVAVGRYRFDRSALAQALRSYLCSFALNRISPLNLQANDKYFRRMSLFSRPLGLLTSEFWLRS